MRSLANGRRASASCGRALAIVLFPIFWVVLTSFKPAEISQALPPVWDFTPTLQNYRDVLTGNTYTSQVFGALIVHSFIVTVASTLLGLLVGGAGRLCARAVAVPGQVGAANWILSTIMFPPVVSVIPVFIIASRLGLTDTWPVLVVPYAAFGLPMMIWMLRVIHRQIPFEIEEAAMIDGASQRRYPAPYRAAAADARHRLGQPARRHAGVERVPVRADADALGGQDRAGRHQRVHQHVWHAVGSADRGRDGHRGSDSGHNR